MATDIDTETLRTFVEVDENNCALAPAFLFGEAELGLNAIEYHDPYSVEIGSKWTGTEWLVTEEMVRSKRDDLLKNEIDPIVSNPLRWDAFTEAKKAEWAVYRQALLDVPQQEGFPIDVVWPVKP